jgi:hypothetical protein
MHVLKIGWFLAAAAIALGQEAPRGPGVDARAGRPGPWDADVLVYRALRDGSVQQLATFPRAGVPTIARLADGRLIAAHQYFPEDFGANFDKVAVRFSKDEGSNWTEPQVIELTGFPDELRFPFDPTLVPLPDGRARLYYTSVRGRRIDQSPPGIYSAISRDGVHFEFEPGARLAVEGRIVIDCAAVLHRGTFHLFSPDNGTGGPNREEPRRGVAYHAVSTDGLNFVRQADVQMDQPWNWLGNAESDGERIWFFGTAQGLGIVTSEDGLKWQSENAPEIRGGDPGAVTTRDGGLIVAITGPPRAGTASAQQRRGP